MTYENFETTLEPVTICTMKPSNLLLLYSKIAPGVKGLLTKQAGFLQLSVVLARPSEMASCRVLRVESMNSF